MSTSTDDDIILCSNCGKGEESAGDLKACTACKMVKYCNRECQIAHRPQHKKACKKRAAELHDEALFKMPPPKEDCPICFLRLPSMDTGRRYYSCCGKTVCSGCIHAVEIMIKGYPLCPFCRTPVPKSDEEGIDMLQKRVEVGDAHGIVNFGCYYSGGLYGLARDHDKAVELWHKAGKLGYANAYHNIGNAYYIGRDVERDGKKADHYYELAAMGGHADARHNLGNSEARAGNWDRAIKHYMIAAGAGQNESVKGIQMLYTNGDATKQDYTKALLAYQEYLEDMRSEQRDQAAVFDDEYKCY